jgi:hypothetical protein
MARKRAARRHEVKAAMQVHGLTKAGTSLNLRIYADRKKIYFDPPYGIKFGSNWQVSTRKRDVKDGKVEEPVQHGEPSVRGAGDGQDRGQGDQSLR